MPSDGPHVDQRQQIHVVPDEQLDTLGQALTQLVLSGKLRNVFHEIEEGLRTNDELRHQIVTDLSDLQEALGGVRMINETYMHRMGESLAYLRQHIKEAPRHAVILGSGLGSFADRIQNPIVVNYSSIPHFPTPAIKGHAGQLVYGQLGEEPVIVASGRVHFYEGYSGPDVAFCVRVLGLLGIENLIVTNAAGGIRGDIQKGDIMLMNNHLNLSGQHPSRGITDPSLGLAFCDVTDPYDLELIKLAETLAVEHRIKVRSGSYGISGGPSYETRLEAKHLERAEVDAAGMSSIFETLAARQMGIRVLGISLVTNDVAGRSGATINHKEVVGRDDPRIIQGRKNIGRLVAALVPALGKMQSARNLGTEESND